MELQEKRAQLLTFLAAEDPKLIGELGEILYSISELNLWPDGAESLGIEQALMCWKAVEKMRTHEVPKELRM